MNRRVQIAAVLAMMLATFSLGVMAGRQATLEHCVMVDPPTFVVGGK